jgi:hypothetical protein
MGGSGSGSDSGWHFGRSKNGGDWTSIEGVITSIEQCGSGSGSGKSGSNISSGSGWVAVVGWQWQWMGVWQVKNGGNWMSIEGVTDD